MQLLELHLRFSRLPGSNRRSFEFCRVDAGATCLCLHSNPAPTNREDNQVFMTDSSKLGSVCWLVCFAGQNHLDPHGWTLTCCTVTCEISGATLGACGVPTLATAHGRIAGCLEIYVDNA